MNGEKLSIAGQLKDPKISVRRLRAIVWLVTICAGFLQAWASRFFLSPDALNYLDLGSAWSRGDWRHAVNAYWSPFFSWLLALCFSVFRPSPYWDSTVIHLVNFVGLLVALRCFEFFFNSFLPVRQQFMQAGPEGDALTETGYWGLGYGLFLSTSLFILPEPSVTTPDTWLCVFTYLVVGLILRIRQEPGDWWKYAALGLALACAYLMKTFYFAMTFVFLATAWFATGLTLKSTKRVGLAVLVFSLLAGPWITVLSRSKGRFTSGDVGKLAYAMMVDQIPRPALWQGENQTGTPKHPVRLLLSKPLVYEFATPITGTYPPGYDWSYWLEGIKPHFDLRGQLRVLRQSIGTFYQLFLTQMEYAVAVLILLFLACEKSEWVSFARKQIYLWLPPLIACLAYALVNVEPRLVAPFVVPLWVAAFSCSLGVAREIPRRIAIALVLSVLTVTGLRVAKLTETTILSRPRNVDWQIAEGLKTLGLQSHDRVSVLSLAGDIHWARSAGVTIVSEIPLGDETIFWAMDAAGKERVFQVLAGTGARMVVTKNPPPGAAKEGWVPLSSTGYYAYRLPILDPQHL